MKKLLILLLALLPLMGQAQRIDNPRTVVRSCEKCTDVLYYITAIVPAYTYPADSVGRTRFQRDILAGKFDLFTDAGVKIPKGTKPPRIMPTGVTTTNPAAGPTWASLRESLSSSGLFYIEAAGTEIARLKIERADGTALSGRNDDNPSLPGNTFYGYGPNANQGLYDRQWKFYFTPAIAGQAIKVTLERTSGETFSWTFTPKAGDDRVVLFTAGTSSGTPVSTTTTTLPVLSRGLIVGNSITLSGPIDNTLWQFYRGMAATADGKDFANLMLNRLRTANANFSLAIQNQGAGLERVYMNDNDDVKNNITNLLYELNQKYGAGVVFDFVYITISENINAGTWNETKFRSMLDRLIAAIPKTSNCTILLRNSLWAGHDASDAFIRAYAIEKGYKFADMAPIKENAAYMTLLSQTDPGPYKNKDIDHHPNDAGMAKKADISLAAISGSSEVVTNPGSGNYAFTNPNPDYVAAADQGWPQGQREKFIQNSQIKVGFLWAGAVISYAGKLSDNQNLVNSYQVYYDDESNDFRYQKTVDDLGRQIMFGSDYCTPAPGPNRGLEFLTKNADGSFKSTRTGYSPASGRYVRPGNPWAFNTGANPVQGGSLFPAMTPSQILASAVYNHPTRGQEFYAKIRAAVWGVKGELGWIVLEEWISLKGNAIVAYVRHTVEERDPARMGEQRGFYANEQENPCIYGIAPFAEKIITTPNGRTDIRPTGGAVFSATYMTPDCRIGMYGNGTGLTYYSPMNSAVKAAQFGGFDGDWTSSNSSYINAAVRINYDNAGIYDDYSYIIVGNESEANQTITTLPGIDQGFTFDFARENVRWWNVDSRFKRESGNQWTWYLDPKTDNGVTSYISKLVSPFRAWQASGISTISFEMAVTGASQLDLIWSKPGIDNGPEWSKRFGVTGDGQFRTYTISTSDANWSGTLSSIGLKAVDGATSSGAKIIIRKISKN